MKRIGYELGITPGRVCAIITAIAYKIHVPPEQDDKLTVAVWWQTNVMTFSDAA